MAQVAAAASPGRASAARVVLRIVAVAIAFRLFSAGLAFACNIAFPLGQPEQFPSVFGETRAFWDPFTRYDSGNYYLIARYGYTRGPNAYTPEGRSTIAYFPVYPLLMRYVGRLFGHNPSDMYRGGILVSWLAFVLSMVLLFRLARDEMPDEQAEQVVMLAMVFPFAFIYGVVYTEATFLLFLLATFDCFRKGRWLAGGLVGALATATRVHGILMLPALALIAWRRTGSGRGERLTALVGLALAASGIGLYSLYIWWLTGNPLEWAATIRRWGYQPGGLPWQGLGRLAYALATRPYTFLAGEHAALYDALNGLTALAFVIAIPFVWWRLGAAYGLFMALHLWLPLSSGQYEGLGRYCAVLFPFFIGLGLLLRSRILFVALLVVFATLYTLCLALFTTLRPIF